MNNSCRIIVGLGCNYKCSYCCNEMDGMLDKFKELRLLTVLKAIGNYDDVCISGGEPLLKGYVKKTYAIAHCAKYKHKKNVYVYTNLSTLPEDSRLLSALCGIVDGWNVGIHPETDNEKLWLNASRLIENGVNPNSIRLMIEQSKAKDYISFANQLNIQIKPWVMDDCDISSKEDWYILKG